MDPKPASPTPSPEEQLLKGNLQLPAQPEPVDRVMVEAPELSSRYCEGLLGQALVPLDGENSDGKSWMTADGRWTFNETDKPVIRQGLGGPRDTGRKLWTVEAQVHFPATREEPESWDMEVLEEVDGLNAAIIKAAELQALDAVKAKTQAIYEAQLAKEEQELEERARDERRDRDEPNDDMDGDFDSAMESAGHGTDEQYEHPGMDDM